MQHPESPDSKFPTALTAETRHPVRREEEKARPTDGIFRPLASEGHFEPSILAGGPWDPKNQHGGAVAGLLTHCLDRLPAPVPMRITRLTIEMFRGVPLLPLRVETRVVRAGKRIQSLEANLFDGETRVARATALRMRRDEALAEVATNSSLGSDVPRRPDKILSLATAKRFEDGAVALPGFIRSVELSSFQTSVREGVPATMWARLLCRVVEGEDPSPTVRMATLVDFASGTGSTLDYTRFTSINPDLTIHVLREPESDWITIQGTTHFAADGIGQSSAAVYDEAGLVARVDASLLLDRRPAGE